MAYICVKYMKSERIKRSEAKERRCPGKRRIDWPESLRLHAVHKRSDSKKIPYRDSIKVSTLVVKI